MSSFLDLVEVLAELFTWVGLVLGGLSFLTLLIVRVSRGSWVETEAVVVDEAEASQLRWMTIDGILHSRNLDADERAAIKDPDELLIHYSRRSPDRMRFEVAGHGEKVLRALGFILLGIAAVSIVVSIVVLFIPH
ncbi:MAG TPA: hypothetical protein VGP24_17355 [Glaciihabitans sp.]|nr:hypothetical protein [Glaciihabitans sp.]